MTRSVVECEYRLMKLVQDRNKDGLFTFVLTHEVILCEDNQTCMVYLYFGQDGDDASQCDVRDIVAVYYDLDALVAEADFDAAAHAACFESTVQSINNGTCFRVY